MTPTNGAPAGKGEGRTEKPATRDSWIQGTRMMAALYRSPPGPDPRVNMTLSNTWMPSSAKVSASALAESPRGRPCRYRRAGALAAMAAQGDPLF